MTDLDLAAGGAGGATPVTGEGGWGGIGIGGSGGSGQAGSAGRGGSGSSGAGGSGLGGRGGPIDASGTGGGLDAASPDTAETGPAPADAAPEVARDAPLDSPCATGGNALTFDGVSSRVTIPGTSLPIANKPRTIEMWMKVKAGAPDWSPNHTVFEYGGDTTGVGFGADMDAFPMMELYVHPSTTSLFFSTGITQESWFHFAATYDGKTLRAFVDGVEKGNKALSAALATTMTPLSVGGGAAARKFFGGSIDELRVWNVARTAVEIQQTMSVRLTGTEAGLVGYWRFDEGTGSAAHDATAGAHDATLVGTTLPAWGPSGVTLCP